MSSIPTPLKRLLFEHGLDLIELKKPTKICYPTLLHVCHGFKVKTITEMDGDKPLLDEKGEIVKRRIKIKYTPEDRTLRDIADFFGVKNPQEVYEHRHEDADPIPDGM